MYLVWWDADTFNGAWVDTAKYKGKYKYFGVCKELDLALELESALSPNWFCSPEIIISLNSGSL